MFEMVRKKKRFLTRKRGRPKQIGLKFPVRERSKKELPKALKYVGVKPKKPLTIEQKIDRAFVKVYEAEHWTELLYALQDIRLLAHLLYRDEEYDKEYWQDLNKAIKQAEKVIGKDYQRAKLEFLKRVEKDGSWILPPKVSKALKAKEKLEKFKRTHRKVEYYVVKGTNGKKIEKKVRYVPIVKRGRRKKTEKPKGKFRPEKIFRPHERRLLRELK